jgi:hypothetical protein
VTRTRRHAVNIGLNSVHFARLLCCVLICVWSVGLWHAFCGFCATHRPCFRHVRTLFCIKLRLCKKETQKKDKERMK